MIDPLFGKTYNPPHYHCSHFLCDAWQMVTGEDLTARMAGVLRAVSTGGIKKSDFTPFRRIAKPESPCIVLLRRHGVSPHVGMFWRGRVLHISAQGVHYMPLRVVSIGFDKVSFYK